MTSAWIGARCLTVFTLAMLAGAFGTSASAQSPGVRYYLHSCGFNTCYPNSGEEPRYFPTALEACQDWANRLPERLTGRTDGPPSWSLYGTGCGGHPTTAQLTICATPGYGNREYVYVQVSRWASANTGVCHDVSGPTSAYIQVEILQLQIAIDGPSRTKALPAGPALVQTVSVTRGGSPAPGIAVSVQSGTAPTVTGTTDGAGTFKFAFVPGYYQPAVESLTASCSGCSNVATKQVEVDPCDICNDN